MGNVQALNRLLFRRKKTVSLARGGLFFFMFWVYALGMVNLGCCFFSRGKTRRKKAVPLIRTAFVFGLLWPGCYVIRRTV